MAAGGGLTVPTQRINVDPMRALGMRNMAIGGLWCVGGLAVTVISYSSAVTNGGGYIVTFGAILFGLLQFLKGAVQISGR